MEVEVKVEEGYVESVERKVGIDSIGDDSADWELEPRDVSLPCQRFRLEEIKKKTDMNEFL